MSARNLMIQGTMSGVGKSLITAGLCRLYARRGLSVAPFKSQNMALNSFVCADGGEIGTATALQALACGKEPVVEMNPILLKPSTDTASQVIVDGRAQETLSACEYFKKKRDLMPAILSDYQKLSRENDLVIIEGAGSCCELNLRKDDIVNMGLATAVKAPVVLVGDIDRGGIFAQLYGSVALLPDHERRLVKALIVNKFRGDQRLFADGVEILEEKTEVKVAGLVPYTRLFLPEEDSVSERLEGQVKREKAVPESIDKEQAFQERTHGCGGGVIVIAVIRFPKISNYTDFLPLERQPGVSVRYVTSPDELGGADIVILPGTKNTIADIRWMKERGIAERLREIAGKIPILGICGGYQMLGESISDPLGIEEGGWESGLSLIPMATELKGEKTTRQRQGQLSDGSFVRGYEIHCGKSCFTEDGTFEYSPLIAQTSGDMEADRGWLNREGLIAGTYWHGFFDEPGAVRMLLSFLYGRQGKGYLPQQLISQRQATLAQLDLFADILEEQLDMELLDLIIEESI